MLPTHHRAAIGAHEGHVRVIGVETASLRSPRIPEGVVTHPSEPQEKPSVSARYGPLGTILRRRRRPLSMRPRTISRTFRWCDRSVNMAKSRQAVHNATIPEDRQNHDYRHTVPLRTHPPPLVRQQAVERRLSEPKHNRRFRAGTSAAEHDYDRRYSACL
jgi:hypothetical protein